MLLAITVVAIAGLGVYSLFHSGMDSYHMSDASGNDRNQAVCLLI